MKTPLSYQGTTNDSAPIAIINALSTLYEREEIDASIIEGIYSLSYSLLVSKEQTMGIKHISHFLEREMKESGLSTSYLCSHEVFLGPGCSLYRTLTGGGKAVAKVFFDNSSRYITITSITNDYLYFFDPLYGANYIEGVERIYNMPFLANGRINMSNLSNIGSIHMENKDQEEKELMLFERVKQ